MNLQPHQIDASGAISGERVVGYADGDDLHQKLAEGFLCGGWSKSRKAYAVLRPAHKRGRKTLVSSEADAEAMALYERILEIAKSQGVTYRALMKRLHHIRRQEQ